MKKNPDSYAMVGLVAAGLAAWALTRPKKPETPQTAGSIVDDLMQATGTTQKVDESVKFVAEAATKGAIKAAKEEVQKYTLPAAIAGVVLGFGLGYFLRKRG